MDGVIRLLRENWPALLVLVGALFVLGAVFRWDWICDPQGDRPHTFRAFVYQNFGETGYRIFTGLVGVFVAACGLLLWTLS